MTCQLFYVLQQCCENVFAPLIFFFHHIFSKMYLFDSIGVTSYLYGVCGKKLTAFESKKNKQVLVGN